MGVNPDPPERDPLGFRCPVCRRTSYHPRDVQHRYCGFCHEFFPTRDESTEQLRLDWSRHDFREEMKLDRKLR